MKAKIITLAASSAVVLFLLPVAAEAVYTGTPSYSTYGSSLNDYSSKMDSILRDYRNSSDLSNLRWQLNDVNSNLRDLNSQLNSIHQQQSFDSIRRLLDAKMGLYKTYRNIGMEVFFPKKKDSANKPICPTQSKVYDDDLCICDQGYVYDLLNSIKLKSDTVCLSKSLYATPASNTQQAASTCPLYSKPSKDGKTCVCDVNYKPDPTETYCVRIRSKK